MKVKINGPLLREASDSLQPHLSGVLDGLCAEVVDQDVIIYKINRHNDLSVTPVWSYKGGEVVHRDGDTLPVTYLRPEGKKWGFFMTDDKRALIALKS